MIAKNVNSVNKHYQLSLVGLCFFRCATILCDDMMIMIWRMICTRKLAGKLPV